MARQTLNLGILAHVDAGKTTLTERLLYAAGTIDAIGSVDAGTTQTDSLALERQRGITIKAAVASFAIGDVAVNLIDTPGHPDFIAEVERVLGVLDGAVLVVSAVEGVQPQTPLLMRALQRLRVPTLVFVNKIDRPGASDERVLHAIAERLTPAIIPLGSAQRLGTRAAGFTPHGARDASFRSALAELLAENDEEILAAYVDGEGGVAYSRLRRTLAVQTKRALVHPVLFGSATTGAGVDSLMAGIAELLPSAAGDADGPVSGTVFKIERGPAREKIAYVRMFSGTVRMRDRLRLRGDAEGKVTAITVLHEGSAKRRTSVSAGEIGKLWGLAEARIGDPVGSPRNGRLGHSFAPPTLETVVVPRDPGDTAALRVALGSLAEQDPLIDVRQDDARHQLSVCLYGEVQKEVIQATLASDFGVHATFRETTPICVERPLGSGEAAELLQTASNPFLATIGFRVDPAPAGSGVEFSLQVESRAVPLYVYKKVESFSDAMREYVHHTLREGLFGWRVTDCLVTLTECGYSAPGSTAASFRKLTPIVLMRALERAGTVVCEPIVRARLESPSETLRTVMAVVARLGAGVGMPSQHGRLSTIELVLPARRADELQRRLAGLTGGEGVLEVSFAGYQPAEGDRPTRRRTTANPLDLGAYMLSLGRRA